MKLTPQNPDFEFMVRSKLPGQHFMNFIGFELTHIAPGMVQGRMPLNEHIKQQTGFVHGGATATFADLVMGFAAYSLVKADQVVVTADLRVSYLNPGMGRQVWAKGWVIKNGQKLIFCEGEIWAGEQPENDKAGVMIAKASSTMAIVNLDELNRKK